MLHPADSEFEQSVRHTKVAENKKTSSFMQSIAQQENKSVLERNEKLQDHIEENTLMPFQSVQGLHTKVFETSTICTIDPLRCLSIRKLRSRSICRWGVKMIRATILGQANPGSLVKGFISTGKFSVLVKIPEIFSEMILEHFLEEGKSREVAESLAGEEPWYHVVDGGHLHTALVELIHDFSENFDGFKWPVVVIDWQPIESIRAISRMCHEMQRESHLIDFTLPDAMQNLRDIIDTQCKRQGIILKPGEKVRNGFIKEVMALYSGRPGYADNTMRNVCGIVVKLSSEVIKAMRLLLTEECEDYCTELGTRKPFGVDTRVYKKLLSSQSLKGVKIFLGGEMTDEDRINVIHRLRFLARERECFRSFSASEVDKQCQCVVAAQKEVSKFDGFLSEEGWPVEMENLKRNILQTTLLDHNISEHATAGDELLPSLVDAYIKATGSHGSQRLGLFRKRVEIRASTAHTGTGLEGSDQVTMGKEDEKREHEMENGADELHQGTKASGRRDFESSKRPDGLLQELGVIVTRMGLLDYERNSSGLERSLDFVVAEPFPKIPCPPPDARERTLGYLDALVDDKGIKLYIQCLRRLLVPGGHLFVFLDWKNLTQWASISSACMFETICEPFLVVRDVNRVQKMKMKGLQSLYEPALVLRKPGKHPRGFTIDRKSPYENLPLCRMPRWCNVIDGVPPPAERLTFRPTKVLVRPTEKPCSLFIEILRTFCPENGRVLDPCAGALTTGLACISTKRSCILLETDEHCLFHALPRLRAFARANRSKSTSPEEKKDLEGINTAEEPEERVDGSDVDGKSDKAGNEASISEGEESGGCGEQATSKKMTASLPVYYKSSKQRESGSFSFISSEDDSTSSEDEFEKRKATDVRIIGGLHVGDKERTKKRRRHQ